MFGNPAILEISLSYCEPPSHGVILSGAPGGIFDALENHNGAQSKDLTTSGKARSSEMLRLRRIMFFASTVELHAAPLSMTIRGGLLLHLRSNITSIRSHECYPFPSSS